MLVILAWSDDILETNVVRGNKICLPALLVQDAFLVVFAAKIPNSGVVLSTPLFAKIK